MAFQRKKVAAALAYAVSVGTTATLLTSVPAYAQDMRVNVTGTSIKRVESETGSPVQVLTREEIDRTGATSVQDLLQFITAATSSGVETPAIGARMTGMSIFRRSRSFCVWRMGFLSKPRPCRQALRRCACG